MQNLGLLASLVALGVCSVGFAAEPAKLDAVPFTAIHFNDSFWAPRIKINREAVIPHNIYECEITGRISNFAKAGGSIPGQFEGIYFNDSDVYKMLEGAAYTLHQERDPLQGHLGVQQVAVQKQRAGPRIAHDAADIGVAGSRGQRERSEKFGNSFHQMERVEVAARAGWRFRSLVKTM